jgi:hypothetical protein
MTSVTRLEILATLEKVRNSVTSLSTFSPIWPFYKITQADQHFGQLSHRKRYIHFELNNSTTFGLLGNMLAIIGGQ